MRFLSQTLPDSRGVCWTSAAEVFEVGALKHFVPCSLGTHVPAVIGLVFVSQRVIAPELVSSKRELKEEDIDFEQL